MLTYQVCYKRDVDILQSAMQVYISQVHEAEWNAFQKIKPPAMRRNAASISHISMKTDRRK